MVRVSRFFMSFLLVSGFVQAGVIDSANGHIRDYFLDQAFALFLINSHEIVEVNAKNYPILDQQIVELSAKAQIQKPTVFFVTKKFPFFPLKSNAGSAGDKTVSVIFVGSWLADTLTIDELVGVLAHEISHIKNNHMVKREIALTGVKVVAALGVACGVAAWLSFLYASGRLSPDSFVVEYKNSFYFLAGAGFIAYKLVKYPGLLAEKWYERLQEKQADLGAVDITGNKELVSALEKLDAMEHKYAPHNAWWSKFWFKRMWADHPQIETRKKYIAEHKIVQPAQAQAVAA